MEWNEYISLMKNSGIEGIEPLIDAAGSAYDDFKASADARISELEETNAGLQKDLTEARARNYVLMTSATSKVDNEPKADPEPSRGEEPKAEEIDVMKLIKKD